MGSLPEGMASPEVYGITKFMLLGHYKVEGSRPQTLSAGQPGTKVEESEASYGFPVPG